MTSPNPPSEQQVQQQPVQPVQQAPAPAPQPPAQQQLAAQPEPMEDRMLTPDETANLLRGYVQQEEPPSVAEREQQQMAAEHFGQIPVQQAPAAQQQAPAQPPAWQPPAAPTQAQLAAAVQQMQQEPQPQQQAQQQQVPGQTPQVSPEVAAIRAEMELMRAQNMQLQQQLQQSQQQRQPQAQPGQGQGLPPAPSPQQPTYNFNVPDAHMAALNSEDAGTRRMALNTMLNAVAETVTQQVRNEMNQLQQSIPQQVQPLLQQHTYEQQLRQDMYGTYPELEPYRTYVEAAARMVEPQFAGRGWSPDYRDAIAERVAPMIPGLYQKIQQIRAQRVGAQQVPFQQQAQPFPQQQQSFPQQQPQAALPPGVQPVGYAGAAYGQPPAIQPQQQPVLARDPSGNYYSVPVAPQPYLGGPQARHGAAQVSPEILDIWQTLNYPTG